MMTRSFFTVVFLCSVLNIPAFQEVSGSAASGGKAVVVEIDGAKLTLEDLQDKRPGSFFQALNGFYQAERKVIDELTLDYLLERRARKENVTVAQLLEQHVDSASGKDPSEEALRVYYEGVDTKEPYEAIRGQILQHIRDTRVAKAKAAYIEALRAEANVVVRLTPPRAQLSLKNTPTRGVANAPVTIIEYADYECAYCQQIQPILEKLTTEYHGKITFAYKDMPLQMHPRAQKAAEAAHCADAQGKYWEYHDLLFSNKQLDIPQLKASALALKLDTKAFDKCLDANEKAETVKAQITEGQALQIQGTPSFFINGRFFSGVLTYEQLRMIVEEELNASSRSGKELAVKK